MKQTIQASITSLHQILSKNQREVIEIEESIATLPSENMEVVQCRNEVGK